MINCVSLLGPCTCSSFSFVSSVHSNDFYRVEYSSLKELKPQELACSVTLDKQLSSKRPPLPHKSVMLRSNHFLLLFWVSHSVCDSKWEFCSPIQRASPSVPCDIMKTVSTVSRPAIWQTFENVGLPRRVYQGHKPIPQ